MLHTYMTSQQMDTYKYVQSHIIIPHQHISAIPTIIISVSLTRLKSIWKLIKLNCLYTTNK